MAYLLRRSDRRTIGLTIDRRGLRVGAPARARLAEIEHLIRRHAAWVLEKLDRWRQAPPPPPAPTPVADGLQLPCLGGVLTVRLAKGRNRAVWSADGQVLTLCLAPNADPGNVLERALRQRVREIFAARLAHYAARLGVATPRLALSSARTRWGSCSLTTGVRLNWRLIFFPLPVVDYVTAHELAHLKEMNHSPRFWAVVAQLYPDWRAQRAQLKLLARQLPHF